MSDLRIEELLARYIDQKLRGGNPNPESLCADCPDLVEPLAELLQVHELEARITQIEQRGQEHVPGQASDRFDEQGCHSPIKARALAERQRSTRNERLRACEVCWKREACVS